MTYFVAYLIVSAVLFVGTYVWATAAKAKLGYYKDADDWEAIVGVSTAWPLLLVLPRRGARRRCTLLVGIAMPSGAKYTCTAARAGL